jgi:hypothetical protein
MIFYSEEEKARYTHVFRQYGHPKLGRQSTEQLIRALDADDCWLADEIISPRLYVPNGTGATYIPLEISVVSQRDHGFSQQVVDRTGPFAELAPGQYPLSAFTYYANEAIQPDNDAYDDFAPSMRVALGPYLVFTFEFDDNDPDFLGAQLSWMRSYGKKMDSRMGQLYRQCQQFPDFAGLSAVWSGNKSVHTNLVFKTDLASDLYGLGSFSPSALRNGFAQHWYDLSTIVVQNLAPDHRIAPDDSIRWPESWRRSPFGLRTVGAGHILGIPKGTEVPQVVLWEEPCKRDTKEDKGLFFRADPFLETPKRPVVRVNKNGAAKVDAPIGSMTSDAEQYCVDRLRHISDDIWPRFENLIFDPSRGYVAHYKNSMADANANSIMCESYSTILPCGTDKDRADLDLNQLPQRAGDDRRTLGYWLCAWRDEYRLLGDDTSDVVEEEIIEADATERLRSDLEQRFADNVVDAKTAREEMASFFSTAIAHNPLLLASGPEGVGKTSTLFAEYHQLQTGKPGMFAFADYKAAEEKCRDFNAAQSSNGFIGVVLESFSEVYKAECDQRGLTPFTAASAGKAGCSSVWNAVKRDQKAIVAALKKHNETLWAQIGDKQPVFFVVHQVAQLWRENTMTRKLWAPKAWENGAKSFDDGNHIAECCAALDIGLLVHDELKISSIVEMRPLAVLRWVLTLQNSAPKAWNGVRVPLSVGFKSYEEFVAENGFPTADGKLTEVSFDDVRKIAAIDASRWRRATTADSGFYDLHRRSNKEDHLDIYAERAGRQWVVASRDWWNGVADRVVLLTTEAVLTAVVRWADPDFAIHELDTPKLARDVVDVRLDNKVRGKNLGAVVEKFIAANAGWKVISNKVADRVDAMNHTCARGFNGFIGCDVVQTMTFITPDEFEQLEALNALCGRSDLVGLRHIDEFNQSAGRNLGFRKVTGNERHVLLLSGSLWDRLKVAPEVRAHSRYGMRAVLTKRQRTYRKYDA